MHLKRTGLGKGLSRRIGYVAASATAALVAGSLGPAIAPAGAAAAPEKTDVMIIFDTSGSMTSELGEAKEKMLEVIEHVKATLPNVEFGVSNVEDIPGYEEGAFKETKTESEYEADSEKAWRLDQPLTTEQAQVVGAIEKLTIGYGGDGPEAYSRALWEADTNPNVGWRAGAKHEVVLIADNVPHDLNLNEGIPAEHQLTAPGTDGFATWPNTGEEPGGRFGIPGTLWTSGTALGIRSVATQLSNDGKPLESVEFYGGATGFLPYWEYWASLSGGQALEGNNGELAAKLTTIIETGATKPFAACPTGQERNGEGICIVPPKPTSHPTVTQVICNLIIATATDTCTATVGDAAPTGSTNPTGTVTFASKSGGVFIAGNSCNLVNTPLSGNTSSCSVQFLPPTAPSTLPAITATYSGDGTHNPSSGSTHYGGLGELVTLADLSEAGTIHPPNVEIPVSCGFPCSITGGLYTIPGLGMKSSVSGVSLLAVSAGSHGKKKSNKSKPVLLGKGVLKLSKPGKGKLIIKLTPMGKHVLGHVKGHGVRLTVNYTIATFGGTLVGTKTQVVTLKPAKKGKGHKKH